MRWTLKKLFIALGVFNFILLILFSVNAYKLYKNNKLAQEAEHNRYKMIRVSDELRQSSDDLTRFVRTYAATMDTRYKEAYFKILDIRNGKALKPENYQNIYWDLLEPLRSKRHPLSNHKLSLKAEMKALPFTQTEFELLQKAEDNSNELVGLEIKAMQALAGRFEDNLGHYTIKGKPDQKFALEILHSKAYHKAKEKIMLPIDHFLELIDYRTQKELNYYNRKIDSNINNMIALFAIFAVALIISMSLLKRRLLVPLHNLSQSITWYKQGKKGFQTKALFEDEIGLITNEFSSLMRNLDEKYALIKKISISDELTGAYNRKFYNEKISDLFSSYKRYGRTFSILMYDIDDFKHINDTYGHDTGDKVLLKMSRLVQDSIRQTDYLCRIGGEEFVVLLPETSLNEASEVAKKLREKIVNTILIPQRLVTISIGVTEVLKEDDEESLYKRTDKLLYLAKRGGKDRVEASV